MTLTELKQTDALLVNVGDIADILGCDPQSIRCQVKANPSVLGFPVTVIGSRVKIPRIPFINFIEGYEPMLNQIAYEMAKRELQYKNLTPEQYEEEIKKLAEKYGI